MRSRPAAMGAVATGATLGLATLGDPSLIATQGGRVIAVIFVGVLLGIGLVPLLPTRQDDAGADPRLAIGVSCGLALSVIAWYALLAMSSYSISSIARSATVGMFWIPLAGWLGWPRQVRR